ncbi:MAG: energy-coupling factor transporter transmembrane component T [Bacillota bacterium]|nr:energy-coupling factor transporter transmembrane component T [Bacillota bacterium]
MISREGEKLFGRFHPAVSFLYFAMVMLYSVLLMHPICLGISFLSAFACSLRLNGRRARRFNLFFLLPMLIICALMNPLFNHEGITILFYLPGGSPITLEALCYGLAAAAMLATAICWFSCFNTVMSSDKLIYLLGRIIPGLSLVISLSLRLVPRFREQAGVIANAQRCLGRDISTGNVFQRMQKGFRIFSMLLSWALENAIETADSMRSRGYGLRGRTAFALYRWGSRDLLALFAVLFCGGYVLIGQLSGGFYHSYYPSLCLGEMTFYKLSLLLVFALLCTMPLLLEAWDSLAWRRSMQQAFPEEEKGRLCA